MVIMDSDTLYRAGNTQAMHKKGLCIRFPKPLYVALEQFAQEHTKGNMSAALRFMAVEYLKSLESQNTETKS